MVSAFRRTLTNALAYSPKAGVPKLGYMYPSGYICLSERVHLRLAVEGENMFIYYFQILIHVLVNTIFKNHYMHIVKIYLRLVTIKYWGNIRYMPKKGISGVHSHLSKC